MFNLAGAEMPERVDMPGTAVKFVYRCSVPRCGFEDRYRDVVEDHERRHTYQPCSSAGGAR